MNPMNAAADPTASIARLIALIDVEPVAADQFRGTSAGAGWRHVYGGQVVAQALMAASKTVDGARLAHSLHAYFLRAGDPQVPIDYHVERARDGQSFSTRRVVAVQHDRQIFNLTASFQIAETGFEHAMAMPEVSAPATLLNEAELTALHADRTPEPFRSLWAKRDRPIEFRPVDPQNPFEPQVLPPRQHNWFRAAAAVPHDPVLARGLLAYASDMTLLDTCLMPHAVAWTDPALQVASIDHALWFHATPDLNDWLLIAQDAPHSGGSRGMNRGLIFSAHGELVATAMQEGLIRYRKA